MRTTLQIPIDRNLKTKSENIASEYGFSSLQELVRVFLKQFSLRTVVPSFTSDIEFLTTEEENTLTSKYLKAKEEIINSRGYLAKTADKMLGQLNS